MYSYLLTHSHQATPFSHPNEALKIHNQRSLLTKIKDVFLSIFREIISVLFLAWNMIRHRHYSFYKNDKMEWKKESKGLVVFIHGLGGDPSNWTSHIDLVKHDKQLDVFIPYVPKRGFCTVEHAAQPTLERIKHYAKANPTMPICLIGHSNGGRIASYLDREMQKDDITSKTPVKVSTIGAIHFGSSMFSHINKFGLLNFFFTKELVSEFEFGSTKAHAILGDLAKPNTEAIRDYEFFASTEDQLVPLQSSTPILGKNEKHRVYSGHGHVSLVDHVRHVQMSSCLTWMKSSTQPTY